MSKADKMFEDMKYVKTFENEVYINYASVKQNILFDLVGKEVINVNNNAKEHLAILEKMKELGWLNEK